MRRGDWREATPTTTTAASHSPCELYTFTAPGYFVIASSTTTVTNDVVFTPSCYFQSAEATATSNLTNNGTDDIPTSELRDPFFTTIVPMSYVLASCTTVAYVLFVFLFLCPPRTRPILQKAATMMVVICLTVAIAKTTNILENEYENGGNPYGTEAAGAYNIRLKVGEGNFIRVGRIISDIFLWLAQVQTLIRLFPRHREKIVLKWAGYALILFDAIFAIMIFFTSKQQKDEGTESPFDAVPVLSYLFQIALAVLYAVCVFYYVIVKRRFAFYHTKKKNMPLLALLGLSAVAIPIIFFCLDITAKQPISWIDFVRWVGAASASVVVWEWVDRIEELEREARRDGVLGREIFDGDDGLDDNSADYDDSRDGNSEKGRKLSAATTSTSDSTTQRRPFHNGEEETYPPLPLSRSNTFASTAAGSNLHGGSRDHTSSRSPPTAGFYMSRGALPADSTTPSATDDPDRIEEIRERHEVVTSEKESMQEKTAEKTGPLATWRGVQSKVADSLQSLRQRRAAESHSRTSNRSALAAGSGEPSGLGAIGEKLQSIPATFQGVFKRPERKKKEPPQRILPVTFIPAPPRNLTMSLRELEEARESGRPYPSGLFRTESDEEDPRPAAIRANAQTQPGPIQTPLPTSPVISRQGSLLIEERALPHRQSRNSSTSLTNDYRSSTRSSTTPSSHGRHSTTPLNHPSTPSYFPPSAIPLPTSPTESITPSAPPYIPNSPHHPPPPDYSQADAARFIESVQSSPFMSPTFPRSPTALESPQPSIVNTTATPSVIPAASAGRDLTPPPAAGNGIGRTVLEREVPEEDPTIGQH